MLSIVIPTYNERENIIRLIKVLQNNLKKLKALYEIIIVDDNSPDDTAKAIRENLKTNKNIRIFVRKNERGLASAIYFGIKRAKGNIIVGMDADLNHPPQLIPKLIEELGSTDLIVASRFIPGGGMEDKARYLFTYIFNLFLKYFLRFPTMDNMSGFYAIKRDTLLQLPLKEIYRGYGEYHLRLVYLAKKYGLKIKEIPVFYKKRTYGKSKTSLFKMFFIYLWIALNLRIGKTNN